MRRCWTDYTQSPSLLKHAVGVEACVRAYGEVAAAGMEEEAAADLVEIYSGVTALLHDFDYERFPSLDDHPFVGVKILEGARLA